MLTRILAAVCRCWPVCIATRAWPNGWFGRTWRKLGRFCPFCRAEARLRARQQPTEQDKQE